jgi:uncharacterized protein YqhQ
MSIGGSAFNNGVKFISDNYTAHFAMDKNNEYKITYNKRKTIGKARAFIKKIPLLKGVYAMWEGNPLVLFITLCALFEDFSSTDLENNIYVMIAMAAITVGLFAYVVKKILRNIKITWMYHGAEHKTIYAYEHKMELTLENVRKCPRIAKRCGTNWVVFVVMFYIIISAISSFFTYHASLVLLASFVLGYEIFDLDKGDTYPVARLFFKFGYFCQQKFFTKEPSDLQIIAAIDTIKKIMDLEKGGLKVC